VLDNFIIHKARRALRHLARLGGHVRLQFLPPYSPESIVSEWLWKQLHDHVTRNPRHRTIEPLMEAVDDLIEGARPFPRRAGVAASACGLKLSQLQCRRFSPQTQTCSR
jgi:transposase